MCSVLGCQCKKAGGEKNMTVDMIVTNALLMSSAREPRGLLHAPELRTRVAAEFITPMPATTKSPRRSLRRSAQAPPSCPGDRSSG
ncbi:hypothetical protein ALQ33_102182 [Pseudomonas syringae pv. philadelphi]|uniref:Uncharacterized protein n=1 Tax=Pseudomonas syringae pv. philadelphi TaxID=251706 RepID=A0A3M3YKJ4_9PSED|nr:hypothetical protein ALQ33_102182 [Pseudomonas syringae pv. philadelphi]